MDIGNFTSKLWDSVYWDPTYARPDKVTSYLNKISKIDQGNYTISKSDAYSTKGEGGVDFGIGGLKFGGESGSDKSETTTYDETNEWLRKHSYDVEIKGEIFVPKSRNLQRLNLGVLDRREVIFTKSVRMNHVDASGTLIITTGQKSVTENEDIKRLRQATDSLTGRLNGLKPRTGQLEGKVGNWEPQMANALTTDGNLQNSINSVNAQLTNAINGLQANKISSCVLCVKPGPNANGGGTEICIGWSNAPQYLGGRYCTGCHYVIYRRP